MFFSDKENEQSARCGGKKKKYFGAFWSLTFALRACSGVPHQAGRGAAGLLARAGCAGQHRRLQAEACEAVNPLSSRLAEPEAPGGPKRFRQRGYSALRLHVMRTSEPIHKICDRSNDYGRVAQDASRQLKASVASPQIKIARGWCRIRSNIRSMGHITYITPLPFFT